MGTASQGHVAEVITRNIHAIIQARDDATALRPPSHRVADRITAFTGSMASVALHGLLFGGWLVLNAGVVPGVTPWDPFPFVMLAMWASVEAIFLTTFVLISQNRMQRLADQRADLNLQIDLLAEHEVTRLLELVDEIAKRLGIPRPPDRELEMLKEDVAPTTVLEQIEEIERTRHEH
ncbi:MAG: hypothetical protein JWP01_289 [Myxococcales bacterium]|nr:hypothetical protein [Myxococcales bacterium]